MTTWERWQVLQTIAATVERTDAAEAIGVPVTALVLAAWANAYGESNFDPTSWREEPTGSRSYGVFQCLVGVGTQVGAGNGHDWRALLDPAYNTYVILGEVVAAAKVHPPPKDPVDLTAWFTRYVERPSRAYMDTTIAKRCDWARRTQAALGWF